MAAGLFGLAATQFARRGPTRSACERLVVAGVHGALAAKTGAAKSMYRPTSPRTNRPLVWSAESLLGARAAVQPTRPDELGGNPMLRSASHSNSQRCRDRTERSRIGMRPCRVPSRRVRACAGSARPRRGADRFRERSKSWRAASALTRRVWSRLAFDRSACSMRGLIRRTDR